MITAIDRIPCQVRLTFYSAGQAAKTNADPDDCHEGEPEEIEFEVLDRRGRPAPWLARKLTDDDVSRIEGELHQEMLAERGSHNG